MGYVTGGKTGYPMSRLADASGSEVRKEKKGGLNLILHSGHRAYALTKYRRTGHTRAPFFVLQTHSLATTLSILRAGFRFQIVLFQLSVERRLANPQNAGRRQLIARSFAQGA